MSEILETVTKPSNYSWLIDLCRFRLYTLWRVVPNAVRLHIGLCYRLLNRCLFISIGRLSLKQAVDKPSEPIDQPIRDGGLDLLQHTGCLLGV